MMLLGLFLAFFQTGLFSFGGGLATIPFIQTLADKTGWFTSVDIMNMIAISEATPGPLGINMATYVGFITSSYAGSIVAVAGLVIPSIVVIVCIAKLLEKIEETKPFRRVFYGLRASSVGLIFLAFFSAFKLTILDTKCDSILECVKVFPLCISIILFLLIKKFKLHPSFYLMLAAIVGIIFKL